MGNIISNIYEKSFGMYSKNYEKKLLKKYGECNKITNKLRLFVISDTHGNLDESEFFLFLNSNLNFDLCIMLGDHYGRDIDIILKYIEKEKICGILGNHDENYLQRYGIKNINGKILNVNGVKILGMQGSFKYRPSNFPSFTQEESIEFLDKFESVDILVTHDRRYNCDSSNDLVHKGLIGITKYIYEKNVPMHIHGHIHEDYEKVMPNETREISVHMYKMVEI